jgi:probable HAF family extracellular repeat protein
MTALPRLAGASGASGAYDINDRGQIVGYGSTNPNGTNPHAVLWSFCRRVGRTTPTV